MNPRRRQWLNLLAGAAAVPHATRAEDVQPRTLVFPHDHGAHLEVRTEWWYATGWLGTEAAPTHGYQITFFRSRTGLADGNASRFAARQLLFAHAAVTQLGTRTHGHDQRIARWNGTAGAAGGQAAVGRGEVTLADWSLADTGSAWRARAPGPALGLDLTLACTQALLLQGNAGYSRKGPQTHQASHYVSEPQLAATGHLWLHGRESTGTGRAWLDHEWSDSLLVHYFELLGEKQP